MHVYQVILLIVGCTNKSYWAPTAGTSYSECRPGLVDSSVRNTCQAIARKRFGAQCLSRTLHLHNRVRERYDAPHPDHHRARRTLNLPWSLPMHYLVMPRSSARARAMASIRLGFCASPSAPMRTHASFASRTLVASGRRSAHGHRPRMRSLQLPLRWWLSHRQREPNGSKRSPSS